MESSQPPSEPPASRPPLPPLGRRSKARTLLVWTIALIGLVVIVAGAAFALGGCLGGNDEGEGGAGATPTPSEPTPDQAAAADVALAAFVRDQLQKEYAGDCGTSILPKGEGRVCSAFKGEREAQRAYIVGASSYEFDLWVFLEQSAEGWKVYLALPVKPETANVPGAPWPLRTGAKVVTAGTGNCLNVRVAPGLKEAAVDCLADGTEIVLAEGPVEVDGFQWWRPEDRSGWVAGDWLRYPEEVKGLPQPTPTSSPP